MNFARKSDGMKKAIALVSALCLCLCAASCSGERGEDTAALSRPGSEAGRTASSAPVSAAVSSKAVGAAKVSFAAVGDDLIHNTIIAAAKTKSGYDYAPFYAHVKSLIEGRDIAYVNQESLLAGTKYGYTGYPCFNGPQECGYALRDLGFNLVNLANNHALDKGGDAVVDNAKFWDTLGIAHIGTNETESQQGQAVVLTRKGVRVAFLAYTQELNGIPLPKSRPWLVNVIDRAKMAADVARAKQQGNVVIVSLHWGTEYQLSYGADQKSLAEYLCSLGVDVIIGTHPHVLEPVEWVTSGNKKTLVYYSLGNFLSAQDKPETMLGAMARFDIVRSAGGGVSIENARAVPLVTHYEYKQTGFAVYPLSAYTDALAARHSVTQNGKRLSVAYFRSLGKKILGQFYAES